MASLYYEIRVTGTIPQEALADFDRITADVEPVETVLYGPLADQAALHGLLARLEMFGVQVIELRRLRGRALPPDRLSPPRIIPSGWCGGGRPAAMVIAAWRPAGGHPPREHR